MSRDGHPTVLIVDDEVDIRSLVRLLLDGANLDVEVVGEAADGPAALSVFDELDPPDVPDVVILDNRMPGPSGVEVAQQMLAAEPRQHIVLFTAHLTPDLAERARTVGIRACVAKENFDRLPGLVAQLTRR